MEEFRTQKSEGAVIHIPDDISERLEVLVGSANYISNRPTRAFSKDRIGFFSALSKTLFGMPAVRQMPDVSTFAYWCRKSNLVSLADSYAADNALRMGLGLSFHICPANVPVNCAFSLAFGFLSGNSCILRLPSKQSDAINILIDAIKQVVSQPKFSHLERELLIARCDRDETVNEFLVSVADCKIIWGGDATVNHFRQIATRPRAREIAFPDRYSFCVLNPNTVIEIDDDGLRALCLNLFNDIYLMDQAACSSPQLIAWIGDGLSVRKAKFRLWNLFAEVVAQRYDLKPVNAVDKYVSACRIAIDHERVDRIERDGNYLYRVELSSIAEDQEACRGYFGTLYEVTLDNLEDLVPIVSERYQTLTYFGINREAIGSFIVDNKLRGIDRVVPVGKAIDMGLVWDGYDIITSLSREIVIQ